MDVKRKAILEDLHLFGSPLNIFRGAKVIQIRNLLCLLGLASTLYYVLHAAVECGYLLNIALAILAVHLANILIEFAWEYLFRSQLTDLESKAIFITGCDSGFGNKLTRRLVGKGITVFAGCLFPEGEGAVVLKKDCSDKVHIIPLDVTKDEQVQAAVATVKQLLNGKKLWSIVNNAGIGLFAETELISMETYKRVIDVNVLGVARVTQAFLPLLRESRGRVVIVASMASYVKSACFGVYGLSKAAVYAYARMLRIEILRWNISVHTIHPWIYETAICDIDLVYKDFLKEWEKVPQEVRQTYGGDNYTRIIKFLKKIILSVFKRPAANVYEVVDCLEDASIGAHPQLHYTPGIVGKLIGRGLMLLPEDLQDLIYYMGFAAKGDCGENGDKNK